MGTILKKNDCNCIVKMQKAIIKKYEDAGLDVDHIASGFDTEAILPKNELFLKFSVRHTKTVNTKHCGLQPKDATKKVNVMLKFCPFCGIRIND